MKRIIIKKVGSIDIDNNSHYVNFHKGLNVITGDRETGKSTILEIIDYCFGKSDNESIPKTITQITKWHFLVCELGESVFLLSRNSTKTTQFILSNLKSELVNYYDIISNSKTTNWNEVNRILFAKHGIEVSTLKDNTTNKERNITYRNCLSLCIQRDTDVLRKDTLFYRMDNENKKRSFNLELPLLCGLVNFNFFKQYDELNNYRKQIEKLKDRIRNYNDDEELSEIRNLISILFLETNNNINVDTITDKDSYMMYKKDLNNFDPYHSKSLDKLSDVKSMILQYETLINEMNYKLRQIEEQSLGLKELSNKFSEVQEKSMIIEDIIEDLNFDESLQIKFNNLRGILNEELSKINVNKSNNLEYEKYKIKKEMKEVEKKRSYALNIYKELRIQHDEDSNYVNKMKNLYKLEAKIEDKFDSYNNYLNSMKGSLNNYETKAYNLERKLEVEKDELSEKLEMLENSISSYINEDIKGFYPEFEHKNKKIGFDLKKMNCYYETNENKVYLPGWGSDNNSLFAHVASTLAFQRTLSNYETCIPSFLIFDQLSRPYFPDTLDMQSSKDMRTLKQIFEVISRVIHEIEVNTENTLQVIIIEHANEGMPQFYLDSKIKDDAGNLITFTDGNKYINEKILKTDIFVEERKKKK